MRTGFLVLALAAVLGVAACGGGDEADPLTLDQRFIQAGDAPGYKPDPVEGGRHSSGNVDEFVEHTHQRLVSATPAEAKEFLTEAGFIRAIVGTRFLPGSDGEHSRGDPHAVMGVVQFESDEGARDAVDWYHEDGSQPCPGKCAVTISEFEVDGISAAKGVRRLVTAEALRRTGEEGEPFDTYEIGFTDGPFAYYVGTFGPPGDATTEAVTEAIAKRIYDRVKDAPPPER
ncbi:MAG: hypothetical protein M3265_05830, partial [Actinomycetota bacterium]|nr:hypothetical protein [Actinomycetota bacterium]